ncbi:MAG: hypothetical protein Q4G36_05430 [Paracoccus sp. (in: a-proteobacteria)]|nr:hypothetical protein [Paracoccus sp. (in: a-proteobacteria)]
MSHNENTPERSANRHRPALVAILVALVVAALAMFVFGGSDPEGDDVSRTVPADAPLTEAEGTDQTAVEPAPVPAGEVPAAPATAN